MLKAKTPEDFSINPETDLDGKETFLAQYGSTSKRFDSRKEAEAWIEEQVKNGEPKAKLDEEAKPDDVPDWYASGEHILKAC